MGDSPEKPQVSRYSCKVLSRWATIKGPRVNGGLGRRVGH